MGGGRCRSLYGHEIADNFSRVVQAGGVQIGEWLESRRFIILFTECGTVKMAVSRQWLKETGLGPLETIGCTIIVGVNLSASSGIVYNTSKNYQSPTSGGTCRLNYGLLI